MLVKTVIAGSRDIDDYELLLHAIKESEISISEVVSGRCSTGVMTFYCEDDRKSVYGVDGLGERWAKDNKVKVTKFPADWGRLGRAAGPLRNRQMAEYGEFLILIRRKDSKGSLSMKREWERVHGSSNFIELVVVSDVK